MVATAPASSADAQGPETSKKRKQLPKIDLDTTIAQATEAMKRANKAMHEARALARNERRKKARLLKKAASLSPADLERIAVLKRCGLWDPNLKAPLGVDAARPLCEGDADAEGAPAAASDEAPLVDPLAETNLRDPTAPLLMKDRGKRADSGGEEPASRLV